MNDEVLNERKEEQKLVKLYMDLTGAGESTARGVWMHVCAEAPESNSNPRQAGGKWGAEREPNRPGPAAGVWLAILWLGGAAGSIQAAAPEGQYSPLPGMEPAAQTNHVNFSTSPLSLEDAVNIALRQNQTILRAQKDLEATEGIIVQTRAVVMPKLDATGSYAAVDRNDIDVLEAPGVTFGNSQNWVSQVRLVQSFYEGGRILSALRVARLTKQQSILRYQAAVADVVLLVQLAYYAVLLDAELITVQEASIELLTRQLTDTTRRYEAGTVPRFDVLRAEVELANARPNLIHARNSFRIAKNNLANLLGFNIPREALEDIPLRLSDKLDAEAYPIDLRQAIATALERRAELGALAKAQALRREDIVNAKSGYKPSLQGYAGYDIHNSALSQNLSYERHGWIAGAQLTWSLFDGLGTQGRIREARANYERAGIELDQEARRIELEVRTMYSNFIEAQEVLESQKKVLEQAAEALRLASARYEAGTGTQLDVLSAQTALTQARSTQVQALHDYDAARARLQRAVGINLTADQARPPE